MSQPVYISTDALESGRDSKYHHVENCSVRGDPNRSTLPERDAAERGYEPCLNCVGESREARLEELEDSTETDETPEESSNEKTETEDTTAEESEAPWEPEPHESDFDLDMEPTDILAIGVGLLVLIILWELFGLWFIIILAAIGGVLYISQ